MKLKLTQAPTNVHTELVGCLGWNVNNELFSVSDDQTVQKWNLNCEPEGKVVQLDSYATDMHWYPVNSKKQQAGGTDIFVVACTDGNFRIVNKSGRVEKTVEAHRGAVICLKWSFDGTAMATGGEDGVVKIWARNGLLRSTFAQCESPVYGVAWGADADQLLYCSASTITIRSLSNSQKQVSWKAHDGVVLEADWSPENGSIVSGGEDCKYKVWDPFGRLLYQSAVMDQPVTAVAWNPSGETFAIGSFNAIVICDRMGWAYSKVHTNSGSIMHINWTAEGTMLAAAGGNGAVCFGKLVDVALEDGSIYVNMEDEHKVVVHDILSETKDELDFRDRVIKMSLGFNHLIVATASQCHIHAAANINTPHIFDLKDTVHLILQCERYFLTIDNLTGMQIYSYEGRQVSNPRFQGLRAEFLNTQMMALSNDTLAVLDAAGSKLVRFFDVAQGKPLGDPYTHSMEIREIALSQPGNANERQLIIIDANRDLYMLPVSNKKQVTKLASMVDSAVWHDTTAMLAAMVDEKLTVWYYPLAVFVDRDMVSATKYIKGESNFGKAAQVQVFSGSRCIIRKSDGSRVVAAASPYPPMLYDIVRQQQWDRAVRLCRFVKDNQLWACLAVMAMEARELGTAEIAFAAIDEISRLRFVLHVMSLPTDEARNGELALYRRRPDEAEAMLVQAGLHYRAIKMNIKLFKWDRALELAQQYKQHIDTVLWYRANYLKAAGQTENDPKFTAAATMVSVDGDSVKSKIAEEKKKEAGRPGANRYMAKSATEMTSWE